MITDLTAIIYDFLQKMEYTSCGRLQVISIIWSRYSAAHKTVTLCWSTRLSYLQNVTFFKSTKFYFKREQTCQTIFNWNLKVVSEVTSTLRRMWNLDVPFSQKLSLSPFPLRLFFILQNGLFKKCQFYLFVYDQCIYCCKHLFCSSAERCQMEQ